MFDPEMYFSQRLAAECGYVASGFYPKADCNEQELKYLLSGNAPIACEKIRTAIDEKPNRRVDYRAWTSKPSALITLNLDTIDQQLAKAGFSLRVRFSMGGCGQDDISQFDMCIKTKLPSGSNIVAFEQTRGEWEVHLDTLRPDMEQMIATHRDSNPPLPEFFTQDSIRNADFFVKTIGGTLRSVYPSYEGFFYKGRQVAAEFHHTEDVKNIFMTPYADIITGEDAEAEAEFMGIRGITQDEMSPDEFEEVMRKSMKLLDRTIRGADPHAIHPNLISKSKRASDALETVYGAALSSGDDIKSNFDAARNAFSATEFSLSMQVKPEDVQLGAIWHHMGHLRAKFDRESAQVQDRFDIPAQAFKRA